MFSFFAHPVTGIAFGNHEVRAARASLKGSSIALLEHALQAISEEEKKEKLRPALQSLQTTGRISLKRSVVLLPAECVYTQLFVVPAVAKKNITGFVNDAVSRMIPEPFAQLKIIRKMLSDSADRTEVGIAAIRQDVLASYQSACKTDKRRIMALTTAPCAIVSAQRGTKPTSFLLASVSASSGQTILTLFHHLWPIDEAILPPETAVDRLVQTAESMAAEYREQGLVIEKMFTAGAFEKTSPATTPAPLSIEPIFPDFQDQSWLAAACASVVNPAELAVNFET